MCPFISLGEENTGDIKLHYEDYGEGILVILIHGYPLRAVHGKSRYLCCLMQDIVLSLMTEEDLGTLASMVWL